MLLTDNTCLLIVDMQNYYLSKESSYYKYFDSINPGCLDYIHNRCNDEVIPNIGKLLNFFHQNRRHAIYLKLCSAKNDRSDLHRFFESTNAKAEKSGFNDIYPLCSDPMADITSDIYPAENDFVFNKKTFSGFNSGDLKNFLAENKVEMLVVTGLATSQCVETTARDASDSGINIIQIHDAQADYDETCHSASIFSSMGVCGGLIYDTETFIKEVIWKN